MVITVVGLVFVGLTTALGFAELGHKVYGLEVGEERFKTIEGGHLPFMEPGLDKALARHLGHGFIPTRDLAKAADESEVVYFCVGTPYGADGQADLTYLFEAMRQVLAHGQDGKFRTLVTKSTVPPSTTAKRVAPFVASLGFRPGEDVGVACNPEFLREGHCWDDFKGADRVVLGVSDERSEQALRAIYAKMECPVFCVSPNTAEFIKYLSNTLLATMISYANEMSLVADAFGDIDTAKAFHILHMDHRWRGSGVEEYVYPGCGYGGYCLPKDTAALAAASKAAGHDTAILNEVIALNAAMSRTRAGQIAKAAGGKKEATIGILGLSFKPGSDDAREAAPAKIIRELNGLGFRRVLAYDPAVGEGAYKRIYPDLAFRSAESLGEVLAQADVLAITTAWPEFLGLRGQTGKPIVDCRYALRGKEKA